MLASCANESQNKLIYGIASKVIDNGTTIYLASKKQIPPPPPVLTATK